MAAQRRKRIKSKTEEEQRSEVEEMRRLKNKRPNHELQEKLMSSSYKDGSGSDEKEGMFHRGKDSASY